MSWALYFIGIKTLGSIMLVRLKSAKGTGGRYSQRASAILAGRASHERA